MARGKSAVEAETQTAADQVGSPAPPASKRDAVRQALGVLGSGAGPQEIQTYLLETFGLEMRPNMISSYKSAINRETGAGKKRRGRRQKGQGAREAPAVPRGINLEDIRAVKELAERIGVSRFRQLVEVLF